MAAIDRSDTASLCAQLKDILIEEIKSGRMRPGRRIPGERVIAATYGVSRGTAVEALKALEEGGYLERIATKGTFVPQGIDGRFGTVNIIFPFPEASMSPEIVGYSSWVADSEIYGGILNGMKDFNARVSFQHFEVNDAPSMVVNQLQKVRKFDGAIFVGQQMEPLMAALAAEGMPYVLIGTEVQEARGMTVSYRRERAVLDCADYLADRGFAIVGILMHKHAPPAGDWKMPRFRGRLKDRGVKVDADSVYYLEDNENAALNALLALLPTSAAKLPDAFFCESMTSPLALLRAANVRKWRVGEEFHILGYAGESALRNAVPTIPYLRIPYFEMGQEACRILSERIRGKHGGIVKVELPARIVENGLPLHA